MIEKPKVSVVIGSYNRKTFLKLTIDCVRTELATTPHEILVVDGGSDDGAVEWLISQKDIITILQHNRGEWNDRPIKRRSWGYFMNLAFKAAQGEYICMLSDDSAIHSGAILNGIDCFETAVDKGEKVGAVAFYFRDLPAIKHYAVAVNVGQLYVNHGLYLRGAVEEVGFIEEDAYHFYFADTDLVLKMVQQGYQCLACPTSFVEHYQNATPGLRKSNNERHAQDRATLIRRWEGIAFPKHDSPKYLKSAGRWDYLDKNIPSPTPIPAFTALIQNNRRHSPALLARELTHSLRHSARQLLRNR